MLNASDAGLTITDLAELSLLGYNGTAIHPTRAPSGGRDGDLKGGPMARIDYSDPATASERARGILGKNRNLCQHLPHDGASFQLPPNKLPARRRHPQQGRTRSVIRELAITRTGILCEAPYEVAAHKRIGGYVGVTNEAERRVGGLADASCFTDMQRAALAFTDEIVKLHRPTLTRPSRQSQPS